MLPSHLLATLLGCALLSMARPLAPRQWLLAIAFGVVIDLDHLLQVPAYIAANGVSDLTPGAILAWGGAWQGFMHTPWALALVVPAMLLFRSWMPLAAWGLHMVLDFVVARHFVRFGGPLEWAIVGALFAALALIALRDHRAHGRDARLHEHVLARVALVWR